VGFDPRLVFRDHHHSDRHASASRATKGASGPGDGKSTSEGIVGTGLSSPRAAKDGDDPRTLGATRRKREAIRRKEGGREEGQVKELLAQRYPPQELQRMSMTLEPSVLQGAGSEKQR